MVAPLYPKAAPYLKQKQPQSAMASLAAVLSSSASFPSRHLPLPRRHAAVITTLALPPAIADVSLDAPAAIAVLVAGSAAAYSLSDPDRRRRQQSQDLGGADDKDVVRDYFNNTGYQRWKKIYGDTTEGVNKVQLDIRLGHSKTVESALAMLRDGGALAGVTVCDAGCGTGSLAIPLAKEGAIVSASDISAAMVAEAESQAAAALGAAATLPNFSVGDLESLDGKYDTVVCLDVLIHYPAEKAEGMIAHLASLAEKRLVVSFAPKTWYYNALKRVGELFPGPSKATRAYLHAERDVERALEKVGWKVRRRGLISTQFYFAKLIEAVPVASS